MRKLHELRGRLDLLPPLAALLETGGVTAAAARLNLSQPAMSRILSQLRSAFGDPLLVRSGASMVMTPRAQALREPVLSLLAGASELFLPPNFDPRLEQRTFRAVIPDVLASYLLPLLLQRLAVESPDSRIELLPWRETGNSVRTPDIVITSGIEAYPSMRAVPLYEDHDVLASRRLPARGKNPLQRDHVSVVSVGATEDPVDRWLASQGRMRHVVTTVPSYLLALHLVATTSLCAILPSRFVRRLGRPLGIKPFELDVDQAPDRVFLLYRAVDEADPAAVWLRAFVASTCALADAVEP